MMTLFHSKNCFKCDKLKPLSDYYRHGKMADGHLNKCKECAKTDVKSNRKSNIDYYRSYDIKRGNRQSADDVRLYREKNPAKHAAHTKVNNAIRGGRLVACDCEVCGSSESVHAHHDDYAKPLDVRWLCPAHHFEWHQINGEGLNA